jgi:hypothetical protein
LREPNAIDFWRGFALVTIFINHIPGNAFEQFTYSGYLQSDAAELFVFLAGWSLALATEAKANPDPPASVLFRTISRTLEVYRMQIVITLMALALIAASALYLSNPILLDWHNAGPFFADPGPKLDRSDATLLPAWLFLTFCRCTSPCWRWVRCSCCCHASLDGWHWPFLLLSTGML